MLMRTDAHGRARKSAHPICAVFARSALITLLALPSLSSVRAEPSGQGAAPPAPEAPRPAAPSRAPAFSLPDPRGGLVASEYASHPVTVVHFWASWCVPCMREIPDYNRLSATYEPKGARVLSVAISSGTAGDLRQLMRAYDVRHTVLMGTESLAREFGGLESFPTTFLIDEEGAILGRFTGASEKTHASMEARIRAELSDSKP